MSQPVAWKTANLCQKRLRRTASILAGRAARASCAHRARKKLASIAPYTPRAAGTHVPTKQFTHPNLRERVESRRVAGVDSDVLSESTGHELAVITGRDAAAGLGRRLHLVRDGMRGLACPPPEGNQGLLCLAEEVLRAGSARHTSPG